MPLQRIAYLQSIIERLLYVTLFLVFIGVGIAFYVALSFGHRLDVELRATQALSEQNHQLTVQLQDSVDQLKISNNQQTAYLQCLMAAQNLGDFPGTCQPPAAVLALTKQPASKSAPSHPGTTAPNSPTPSPSPAPKPSALDPIGAILKALGL